MALVVELVKYLIIIIRTTVLYTIVLNVAIHFILGLAKPIKKGSLIGTVVVLIEIFYSEFWHSDFFFMCVYGNITLTEKQCIQ